jgi:hypothetical protein
MVRKLDFIDSNAAPPSGPTIWSEIAETWRKVWTLIAIIFVVALISAIVYWLGPMDGVFNKPLSTSQIPGIHQPSAFGIVFILA